MRALRLGAALAALAGCAEAPPPCPDGLVLRGVTVIDGRGNPPVPDQAVVVCGGRIEAVGAAADAALAPGADVRDLGGTFVVPGFIDTHAHVTVLPMGDDGRPGDRMDRAASEHALSALLASGVTTVRNPAAPTADGVALREAVASGAVPGPTIVTAGEAIGLRGAAGWTEATVRDEVRRQAEGGVDLVKLYAPLGPDLVAAATAEAHRLGLETVAHLGRTTWGEAAAAGVDHVTHVAPWSAAYLPEAARDGYRGTVRDRIDWLARLDTARLGADAEALAAAGATLDPTLVALHTKFWGRDPRYRASPDSAFAPPLARDLWRRGTFVDDWTEADVRRARALWPRVEWIVRRLDAAGVRLTAGSDLPNPWVIPGVSLHQEMALLAAAGLEPLRVLQIATHDGAVALGLGDRTGSVEVGKEADLVVLGADPLADIAHTRSIRLVVVDGRPVEPGADSVFNRE